MTQPPITSPHAPDIAEVRTWLEKMVAEMKLIELVVAVVALITRMRDLNTELTKQLANLRRSRPKSETLERLQRQLSLSFMADAAAKTRPDGSKLPKQKKPKKSRKGRHPGRAALPDHLERIPVPNPVPPELRICPVCRSEMTTVGHSICERLGIIPARLVVLQRQDERVACPNDDAIVSAPTPPQIVERGKLSDEFIVESLCDKYLDHQPIERQCTVHALGARRRLRRAADARAQRGGVHRPARAHREAHRRADARSRYAGHGFNRPARAR